MKKTLVLLLILAVAGGMAFAQQLTWNGQLQTGVWFRGGDNVAHPNTFADDDDSGHGVEAKIVATYDADVWGFKFAPRVVSDAVNNVDDPLSAVQTGANLFADDAYGWINFLDKMINVKTGYINDAVWGNAGQFGENYDAGLGVRLEIMPIDGLNVGAFFNYPDGGGYANKNTNFLGETAFGFKYTADVWNLSATLKLYSEESTYSPSNDKTDVATWAYLGDDAQGKPIYKAISGRPDMKMLFGFGFTGVQNLTVIVDGHLWYMNHWSDLGLFQSWEEFAYKLSDPFTVGLNFYEAFSGNSDIGFYNLGIWPYAYYMITDNIQLGLDLKFFLGKNTMAGVDYWNQPDVGLKTDANGKVTTNDFGFNEFNPDIFVKYTAGNAWVQATYVLDYWMKDYNAGTLGKTDDAAVNHLVKIVFGYSF